MTHNVTLNPSHATSTTTTTAIMIATMSNKQHILARALFWYLEAVLNSEVAFSMLTAVDDTFDSILSIG